MTAITEITTDEKSNKSSAKHLDDFLHMGRYSFLVAVLCELMSLNQAGNMFFMVFAGAPPTIITCRNGSLSGLSESELCSLYHNGTCDPIMHHEFLSVNVEWKHICNDGKQVKDSISYQMAGYIFGALFMGQISDVYGRKWPMFICLLATLILGIASVFSANLFMFTIIRTLISFFSAGHICTMVVFMCETFPKKHRMWITFILSWSPNIILFAAIAYMFDDWKTSSIALNSLAGVACVILWFAHESPYWLVGMGRMMEAKQNLIKVSHFDGQMIDIEELQIILEKERTFFDEKKFDVTYSYQHLFYSWRLTSFTLTIGFSYFAVSIVHYGILFNMETISGSMYLNMMFVGVVRFILNLVSAFSEYNLAWYGRKASQFIFSAYGSLSILAILVIQVFGYEKSLDQTIRFLTITGGSVICQIYAVIAVSTNEIFPTPIRNIAYALMFLNESLGTALGPQIYELNELHVFMPNIVMLILTVSQAIFFSCFIPESKGKQLADRMPGPDECIYRRKPTLKNVTTEA